MSEPFLGEIRICGFNFPPKGWALCNGQLLPINQNQALFALLGTNYGGDGIRTFALPDLRGRLPVHQGQGNGLAQRVLGQKLGEETHTLQINEMPTHTHTVNASRQPGDNSAPAGILWATTGDDKLYSANANTTMNPNAAGATGQSQSHNNMQPYLVTNFIIALTGIFPSRN